MFQRCLHAMRASHITRTTVISDQWRAYNGVGAMPGMTHMAVNHPINFVGPNNKGVQ